jgi:hypothetical protein
MTYKELVYFTGHCLSLDEHPSFRETIINRLAGVKDSIFQKRDGIPSPPDEIDIENFVQLCSDHLIIPAIYLKFQKHHILELLPNELVESLQGIYELNRERNEQILKQIDDIAAELNKENIQPVFLKGTANLLDGLYSDLGERLIGDIDLLVSENDYLRTAAILKACGYRHHETISYVDFTSRKHYPALHKNGAPASVEIHRIMVSDRLQAAIRPEDIFRDKEPISGKHGIYVPSDAHKLTHTFAHDQLEDWGNAYKQAGFRAMYDLYLLSKRMTGSLLNDQNKYRKQAVSWLVLCQRVLGLPGRFYPVETLKAKWFCLKYDISLLYAATYNAYNFLKKLIFLVVHRYVGGLLKAIFLKKERQFMIRRLSNSIWYREHWEHYKSYFS